jgi:hypothetical protein
MEAETVEVEEGSDRTAITAWGEPTTAGAWRSHRQGVVAHKAPRAKKKEKSNQKIGERLKKFHI